LLERDGFSEEGDSSRPRLLPALHLAGELLPALAWAVMEKLELEEEEGNVGADVEVVLLDKGDLLAHLSTQRLTCRLRLDATLKRRVQVSHTKAAR